MPIAKKLHPSPLESKFLNENKLKQNKYYINYNFQIIIPNNYY